GESARRFAQPGSPWSVPGTGFTKSLYSEGRRAAAPVGCRGAGGQDCSTGRGDHSQCDLRGGLQGLFVRLQARSQPASGTGCAECGAPPEASELGAGCGHSRVLRPDEPRMDDKVCPAPSGRTSHSSPDRAMGEGGREDGG